MDILYFFISSGIDPDGGAIRYSISGPVFSVDRDTGVVRLRQELDREKQDTVEVIISITGELAHACLYLRSYIYMQSIPEQNRLHCEQNHDFPPQKSVTHWYEFINRSVSHELLLKWIPVNGNENSDYRSLQKYWSTTVFNRDPRCSISI